MRCSEPRSGFVPDNKAAEGEWYWIDAPGIAQSLQLPADTPLVEVGGNCCGSCWLAASKFAPLVMAAVFAGKQAYSGHQAAICYCISPGCSPSQALQYLPTATWMFAGCEPQ